MKDYLAKRFDMDKNIFINNFLKSIEEDYLFMQSMEIPFRDFELIEIYDVINEINSLSVYKFIENIQIIEYDEYRSLKIDFKKF